MNCSHCFRDVSCPVCGVGQNVMGVEHEGVFLFTAECEQPVGCGVAFDDEGVVNRQLTDADRLAHDQRGHAHGVCAE